MITTIEKTLMDLENGAVPRREAVARLGALVAVLAGMGGASASEEEPGSSTFVAKGLNHIALDVTDVARSRDFYKKHLGMSVLDESASNCFMSCGPDNFVALFKSDKAGLDHYCYTIDNYDAGEVVDRLKSAGFDPERVSNRVYFDDPDGLTVQLAGKRSSRPG
ncbi:MAG: VOC family protein [Acidobacteriota bacterium]|nr:VOC family protein [Acidobacteriota bacterium]